MCHCLEQAVPNPRHALLLRSSGTRLNSQDHARPSSPHRHLRQDSSLRSAVTAPGNRQEELPRRPSLWLPAVAFVDPHFWGYTRVATPWYAYGCRQLSAIRPGGSAAPGLRAMTRVQSEATLMREWNRKLLVSLFLFMSGASQTRANIYEWAWVNPNDPSQGVVQTSVVCPGGSGVSAESSADLGGLDLVWAYLIGARLDYANLSSATLAVANLTNASLFSANLSSATLTDANLTGANLTIANLSSATLTNATLTGAAVGGAAFGGSNLTAAQLYSTASYHGYNLENIDLHTNNLTAWNFSGQDLTSANLASTTLTNANLTGAT